MSAFGADLLDFSPLEATLMDAGPGGTIDLTGRQI
jgi:hypothetical protein